MNEYNFDKKSSLFKFTIPIEHKLKIFFSRSCEFPENIIKEDSNETGIENDVFDYNNNSTINKINPAIPLKKEKKIEDELLYHYSNSIKENNSNPILKKEKRKLFKVNYRIRFDDIFDKENILLSQKLNEKAFLENKVTPTKKRRRENWDNIRKKIKTIFFNKYIYNKINDALKAKQSKLYFVKFPITFVNDIKKDTNKDIINKTLLEIMSIKEIYDEKDLNNYYHNLKVLENKEINENEELKEILNKKYSELFQEYINSKEFNIIEINRLKNNDMDNSYIERYIYQSKHFIEYFSELDE